MIPVHFNPLNIVPKAKVFPTRTYNHRELERFSEHDPYISRIAEQIDGLVAMEQRVLHILRTERYRWRIYPKWYGIELEKYHKRGYGYFRATIHQTLKDALLIDDRIDDVTIQQIGQVDIDACFVSFTVHTNLGNIAFRAEVAA